MRDKWVVSVGTVLAVAAIGLLLSGANWPATTKPVTPKFVTTKKHEADLATIKGLIRQKADQTQITGLSTQIQAKADQSAFNRLQTEVGTNQASIGRLTGEAGTAKKQVVAHGLSIKRLTSDLGIAEKQIVAHGGIIKELSNDLDDAKRSVENHRDILNAIAQLSVDNTYIPKIEANMTNEDFRQEMNRVVDRSIQRECRLRITNRTTTAQRIRVNEEGNWHWLQPDERTTIKVPTGNVSTRLYGQELVNWAVGPPTYEQAIAIVQRKSDRFITYSCNCW